MSQPGVLKEQVIKSYIDQIFSRYDSNSSNTLNPTQVTGFFNDLFRSLNVPLVLTPQQSVDAIKAIYPSYNGLMSREQVLAVFKVLLSLQQPQTQTVRPPINNPGYQNVGQNGGYINMPNYMNVNINNGFVPQQGYIINPNMVNPNQPNYPNGYMQGFNGYQNPNQFSNFRRQ